MKLKLIKSLVYIMSLMLIVGICFLIYGMWNKSRELGKHQKDLTPPQFMENSISPQSSTVFPPAWQQTIELGTEDEFNETWTDNGRLVTLIQSIDGQHIVYIHDMVNGRLIGTLTSKPAP